MAVGYSIVLSLEVSIKILLRSESGELHTMLIQRALGQQAYLLR